MSLRNQNIIKYFAAISKLTISVYNCNQPTRIPTLANERNDKYRERNP